VALQAGECRGNGAADLSPEEQAAFAYMLDKLQLGA
jgi:hypothetical protein